MKKEFLIKVVLILLISSLIGGCASVESRFPDFDEYVAGRERIDVIIDSVIFSDLPGSDLGFNRERNRVALELLSESVKKALTELGYKPNFVYTGHGIYFEPEEGIEYFYSEKWQRGTDNYVALTARSSNNAWESLQMKEFFGDIIQRGEQLFKNRKMGFEGEDQIRDEGETKSKKEGMKLQTEKNDVPEIVENLPSGVLLYVNVDGLLAKLSKRIGSGLLWGTTSAVATGGFLVTTGPPLNCHILRMAVLDIKTNEVVWFQGRAASGLEKTISKNSDRAFDFYPTVKGRYLKRDERETRRKQRLSN